MSIITTSPPALRRATAALFVVLAPSGVPLHAPLTDSTEAWLVAGLLLVLLTPFALAHTAIRSRRTNASAPPDDGLPPEFSTLPLPVVRLSEGRIQGINDAAVRLLGAADARRIMGHSFSDYAAAEHREHLRSRLEQTPPPPPFEFHLVRSDGQHAIVESIVVPVAQGVLLVLRDVTEQQRLTRRYRLLAAALRGSSEALCIAEGTGTDHLTLLVNDTFSRMTGLHGRNVLGQPLDDVLGTILSKPKARLHLVHALERRRSARVDVPVQNEDGSAVWAECELAPIFDGGTTPSFWVLTLKDIARRKLVEGQLRAQAALLSEAQDAIYVREMDGNLLYWNRGAERLYGWKAKEVLGKDVDALLFRNGEARFHEALNATLESGKWMGELTAVSRTGKERIVASRWTLIPKADGQSKSILVVNTDITEKKRLETQLLRAQRLESIGTLASGIAHDLNNVLNPILMSCGLLLQETEDSNVRQIAETIEMSARRGSEILKQVLTFAKGAATGKQKSLDLTGILHDIERLIRKTFPRAIDIHVKAPDDLWTVKGNRTQVEQIIMNLSVNARDAMPDGGTLRIQAANVSLDAAEARRHLGAQPGPYVRMRVMDTGVGISEDVLDKVFEPFFTTKQAEDGTGLGLSTVHSIVDGMNGFIYVESEPGQGAAFDVYLPRLQHDAPNAELPALQPSDEETGELLLLVDDELGILTLARKILEHQGYRIMTAQNGDEALKLYKQHEGEIAGVITDRMMPKTNGDILIRALVQMDPNVKILVCSGYLTDEGMASMEKAGAHLFLHKPFSAEQLVAGVQQLLRLDGAKAR